MPVAGGIVLSPMTGTGSGKAVAGAAAPIGAGKTLALPWKGDGLSVWGSLGFAFSVIEVLLRYPCLPLAFSSEV